jgi:protein-serine/threonine kinase
MNNGNVPTFDLHEADVNQDSHSSAILGDAVTSLSKTSISRSPPSHPPNLTTDFTDNAPPSLSTPLKGINSPSSINLSPRSPATPLSTGLRVHTDINSPWTQSLSTISGREMGSPTKEGSMPPPQSPPHGSVGSQSGYPVRNPSISRARATTGGFLNSPTTNSALSSPMLDALTDLTPLPSPLGVGDSPGPWRRLNQASRNVSRESLLGAESVLVTSSGESVASAIANQQKRKTYQGLGVFKAMDGSTDESNTAPDSAPGHSRNRSISEYVPESLQPPKPRHIAVSISGNPLVSEPVESPMRREERFSIDDRKAKADNLAASKLPTPPPSTKESSDSDSSASQVNHKDKAPRKRRVEYYDATTLKDGKRRRWRAIRKLGEGSFSKVMLATSQSTPEAFSIDEEGAYITEPETTSEQPLDPKRLVAVKVIEHGPAGGADEERVDNSLKRELDILKSVRHPSLVDLKAFSIERTRALLVMTYCPGGDLFEVASQHHDALTPSLIRRIFAELVGATRYLHSQLVAHRDIKLES